MVADPEQIDRMAKLLSGAANPIIITEHGGRTERERKSLVKIAEVVSAPVFEFMQPAYHNFPRIHPLYGAGPVEAVLGEADAVLLAGCNAPWHPPRQQLRPDCAVIHLEEDPLRPRAAYWGYATTHTIPGDRSKNLEALAAAIQTRAKPRLDSVERWKQYTSQIRAKGIEEADLAVRNAVDIVPAAALFRALHDALPEDAICVDEIIAQIPQMIQFLYERKPFQQYRGWVGALGTSLGTAWASSSPGRSSQWFVFLVMALGITTLWLQPSASRKSIGFRCSLSFATTSNMPPKPGMCSNTTQTELLCGKGTLSATLFSLPPTM